MVNKHTDDLFYETSRWERRMFDKSKKDVELAGTIARHSGKFSDFERLSREIYARMYSPTDRREHKSRPGFEWAEEAHRMAEELPDFKRLMKRTAGNRFSSTIATSSISDAIGDSLPGRQDSSPDDPDNPCQEQAQHQSSQVVEKMKSDGKAARKIRQAIRSAAKEAAEQIDKVDAALQAFGAGSGAGNSNSADARANKQALANRIMGNEKLMKMAELAGRFKNIAQKKQRSKTHFAREEVADVEVGSDLSRILPTELARLADPSLELGFLRDYAEGRLMQYRMKGNESQGKGPIIMCIDESGSMHGDSDVWAKAIFLAMLDVAKKQKRTLCLVHFDSQTRTDVFSPGEYTAVEVISAVDCFLGGGTDFKRPISECMDIYSSPDKSWAKGADVIFITDGCSSVDDSFSQKWSEFRDRFGVSCFGVSIDHEVTKELESLCDSVMKVTDLGGAAHGGSAVLNRALSI